MGCRPVLAIDSYHLSGPYKGALLSAIAYDANDGMFPLALGVVGSENYEDWLPCPHVCVVIILRHDVYDYIDPCFKVSTQHLIYSGQFQPLPTHNMPKVCEAGTLQDGRGNVFPSLQPPQVRRPLGRPR
ncbi:hypothetical protein CK203_086240 [Vitis vinifera]|uniref:Uncharacterized protein n=1 Tax=Vitis vinifera TaxID=29760 RepID=A0A438EE69_VITVI|nr:hypothetical protein CK203_086240 [Vitis vinifera]